jgi:hypothetical protein
MQYPYLNEVFLIIGGAGQWQQHRTAIVSIDIQSAAWIHVFLSVQVMLPKLFGAT